jgi:signal transduction histidine kinase
MRWFHNSSIRRKLTLVIVLTSAIALLLATVAAVSYEFFRFHREKVIDLAVQAKILEANTAPALAARDFTSVRQTLAELKTQHEVVSARIFDRNGSLFAEYVRPDAVPMAIVRPGQTEGYRFEGHHLLFYAPIRSGGQTIGTLVLRTDIRELQNRFMAGAGILATVMLASVVTAILVAGRLQRLISAPISDLARVARTVAESKNYSLRAPKASNDEIGFLTESFNQMLAQIQARDAERKELQKRLLEVSDREQARIGQDIHDGLCQQLVGASFNVALLREDLPLQAPMTRQRADKIAGLLNSAIAQARNLAGDLYPVKLETEGLLSALQGLAAAITNESPITCEVQCRQSGPVRDPAVAFHLYRIATEAVNNALKHAGARHIVICLSVEENITRLSVSDDGMGIAAIPPEPHGMGLHIMKYRADMIGGTLSIGKNDMGGTIVSCMFQQNGLIKKNH